MTTHKLFGGDLGSEKMFVRCDLSQASACVEVNYDEGSGWEPTQYQCADCLHTHSGLIRIGKELAARAVAVSFDIFVCNAAVPTVSEHRGTQVS